MGEKKKEGLTLVELQELTYTLRWESQKSSESSWSTSSCVLNVLGDECPVAQITERVIHDLVLVLRTKGNSAATVNRKLTALRTMLTVAKERGAIPQLPGFPKKLKEPKGKTRWITDEEEARIKGELGEGNAFLVTFLIDTGMRLQEALDLGWSSVLWEHETLCIERTKADLPRVIPMTNRVRLGLELLSERAAPGQTGPFQFFVKSTFQHTIRDVCDSLGLTDVSTHCFRHTCASRLAQADLSILKIQKWLGHHDVSETMRYAHLSPQHLERGAEILDSHGDD